jgi:hypothetical protein
MGRYTSGNDSMEVGHLLRAFGGGTFQRCLAQKSTTIENSGLSLLAYTQPVHMEQFSRSDTAVSGLLARILVVATKPEKLEFADCGSLPCDVTVARSVLSSLNLGGAWGAWGAVLHCAVVPVCALLNLPTPSAHPCSHFHQLLTCSHAHMLPQCAQTWTRMLSMWPVRRQNQRAVPA